MADTRIYPPAKNAMQPGLARTRRWLVEYSPTAAQRPDPLMGWSGGGDTRRQVRLSFATRDEAIAFARKHDLTYQVEEPNARRVRAKTYADNFSAGRTSNWTH